MSPLLYSRSNIYKIQNCPSDAWYVPSNIQRCIVIRAAAFDSEGQRVGNVTTNSYFIRDWGCDTHALPVMSLCIDSLDLFDYNTGIFVPGIHYDPSNPNFSGNYFQTGLEWEKPCNVEFYENNQGINQLAGIRTQGYSTRRMSQKGLKIYARDKYGKKRFKFPFFKELDIESFKHLKLKPYQGGWEGIGCEDYICGQMARNLDLDCLASRPMVLYINGEYWGIYYLQEKPDERFLEDHYNINLSTLNIVSDWSGNEYDYGSGKTFRDLYHWFQDHDLTDEANYQYAQEKIDISNFIDYEIFELFIANQDWPSNNMRCWQVEDGKWRWIFYDGDACLLRGYPNFDALANATYNGYELYPSSRMATLFFRKLMENESFKTDFIKRFRWLLATELSYTKTKTYYEEALTSIAEEIPYQSDRFNNPLSMKIWKKNTKIIDGFLSHRYDNMNNMLRGYYLADHLGITIDYVYSATTSEDIHVGFDMEGSGLVDIQVFDIMGRQLYYTTQIFGSGKNEILLPSQPVSGVYIVKIGGKAKKFVIAH